MDRLKTKSVILPALLAAYKRMQPEYSSVLVDLGPLHEVDDAAEVKEAIKSIEDETDWTHDFFELMQTKDDLVRQVVDWLVEIDSVESSQLFPHEVVQRIVVLCLCKLGEDEIQ